MGQAGEGELVSLSAWLGLAWVGLGWLGLGYGSAKGILKMTLPEGRAGQERGGEGRKGGAR